LLTSYKEEDKQMEHILSTQPRQVTHHSQPTHFLLKHS
jgi:hypothetical protein